MLAEKFIKSRNILLKQHRTSLVKYPTEFTLMGKNVRVLQSPQSRLLPAEILILGLAKLDLYSAGSSAIFSNHFKQYNLFTTHATKDTKDYGLMYKRLGINLDSNLKDAPDAAM
jgi:hypothetical protein